jgi:Ca2+-dependent lipid-binding protein
MDLQLLPNEKVLEEGSGHKHTIWLTNQRVVQQQSSGVMRSNRRTISIPLEHINSIETATFTNRWFLAVALVFAIGAAVLIFSYSWLAIFSLFLAVLFGLTYYSTRGHGVSIKGVTSTISFQLAGHSFDYLEAFVARVEHAKQEKSVGA